jgi:hypothetical protein
MLSRLFLLFQLAVVIPVFLGLVILSPLSIVYWIFAGKDIFYPVMNMFFTDVHRLTIKLGLSQNEFYLFRTGIWLKHYKDL